VGRRQLPFSIFLCYRSLLSHLKERRTKGAEPMEWEIPQHEEIDLNCEVSSYANAEL
jgi:hypothetical protein